MIHNMIRSDAVNYFRILQDQICTALQLADGTGRFREDSWQRPEGGGGRSRVMDGGSIFEKAGVNFSEVYGDMDPAFAKTLPGDGTAFVATGISLVLHPISPMVPTVHANFRFLAKGNAAWFGGGGDLTPYYPFHNDVVHFHQTWQRACAIHPGVAHHAELKRACDDYFFIKHRGEARGVGGIFFDNLSTPTLDQAFAFVRACGDAFLDSYLPIVSRRKHLCYTPEQRVFQEYRRGRYVEFNLVYDRGTLFGLKTNGRIESILMSLPPVVRYVYDYQPEPGSAEARLTADWLVPRDWANQPLHVEPTTPEADS